MGKSSKSLGLTYYPRYNIAYLHRKDIYWSEIPLLKNTTIFTCDLKSFKKIADGYKDDIEKEIENFKESFLVKKLISRTGREYYQIN